MPPTRSSPTRQTPEQQRSAAAKATRYWRLAFGAAILLLALAVAGLVLVMVFITIADRSAGTSAPAPLYLITDDRAPLTKWFIGGPGVLLLLAIVVAFLAELYRRATWRTLDRGFFQGGSRTVDLVALPVRTHVAGTAVAFAAWVGIIVVPVISASTGGWPSTLHQSASDAAWNLLVAYGGISAGLGFASLASLLKKLTYASRAEASADAIRAGSSSLRFWRWFSFRWRFEIWVAGIGGAILGGAPVALLFAPPSTWLTLGGVGAVLVVLAVVLCLNSWRSGEPLTRGESVS